MYKLDSLKPIKMDEITFSELGMKEHDIEEIIRKNIDMVCSDEESMLVVGQQVKNTQNGRSDLTAVDNEGNLVLIELKRDKKDIETRIEAFEFQAIRYAASCATIESTDELISNVFTPYIEKHRDEFGNTELSSSEIASRVFYDFKDKNNIVNFNANQRIILVASDFDEQTLSAVAWLNSNKVDISCYKIVPYKMNENVFVDVKRVLPVMEYSDFYVNIATQKSVSKGKKRDIIRRVLPKIDAMLEWGVVKEGDIIVAKGTEEEVVLLKDGNVKTKDEMVLSLQQWLKGVYGWSSVQTYVFALHKESGKLLCDIREEYMQSEAYENRE